MITLLIVLESGRDLREQWFRTLRPHRTSCHVPSGAARTTRVHAGHGVRSAAGGRTPVQGRRPPWTPAWPLEASLATDAGHQPSDGRSIVPEAADGQSADRSGSLQLAPLFSRPALRAAFGRPPARQRHDGHRGTDPTLHQGGTTRIRQSGETEPTRSGPASAPRIRPATHPSRPLPGTAMDSLMPGRSSAGFSPAQARGLGPLLHRDILSPVGMLPGLRSQWATLISELPVHPRDFLLGLGNRLRSSGDLLPQRLALRLRLLGSLEHIRAVGGRVIHDGTDTLPSPVLSPRRMGSVGYIGATSPPSVRDNSGNERSANTPAQQLSTISSTVRDHHGSLSHGGTRLEVNP
jgi:hypothetical protein